MTRHRIFDTSFASVYPHYVAKAQKKGRSREELDTVIGWLTGYDPAALQRQIDQRVSFEAFFAEAPAMNGSRSQITGLICGVRVEQVEDPLMQEIRRLDKLVDELAKGRAMEKILRVNLEPPTSPSAPHSPGASPHRPAASRP